MTIELSKVNFINDFFSTMLPDGSMLVLNKVDEDFLIDRGEGIIKAINIEVQKTDDIIVACPCVIGIGNDLMQIKTEYKEYEGKVLTPDNMAFCTVEVYE